MILGKSLNHDLLSAGWNLSRGGALFFDGQEEKRLHGIHQSLVTAVREASLLSFSYFISFYILLGDHCKASGSC